MEGGRVREGGRDGGRVREGGRDPSSPSFFLSSLSLFSSLPLSYHLVVFMKSLTPATIPVMQLAMRYRLVYVGSYNTTQSC